ncbi:MAG: phosphatidylinositol kinase [Acidimicrobiaceae bacterium]|nr:phosphatidylinositol kinase [Acidimicrobiaceae bacterium]
MDKSALVELLSVGEVTVVGRVPYSSNQALLVNVSGAGDSVLACYKAEMGERPLWDFPDGLWRREVAAYALDQIFGLDAVPVTVGRDDLPFGPGSLQWWINDATDDHYFTLREHPELEEWLQALAVFDVVANNADRKAGHVIFDGARCWAIDNGLCFHAEEKLRTVIWDYLDTPIPELLVEPLEQLAAGHVGDLGQWLDPSEIAATRARADHLVRSGVLPAPDEDRDWPPYPWPLI